jgi:hypothetical protein
MKNKKEEIDLKDLASGVSSITEFSKEQTELYAKIFIDHPNNPVKTTLDTIIKEKIKGYYWTLAHVPNEKRSIVVDTFISGIIQALEQVLQIAPEFIQAGEEIKKEDKK